MNKKDGISIKQMIRRINEILSQYLNPKDELVLVILFYYPNSVSDEVLNCFELVNVCHA